MKIKWNDALSLIENNNIKNLQSIVIAKIMHFLKYVEISMMFIRIFNTEILESKLMLICLLRIINYFKRKNRIGP